MVSLYTAPSGEPVSLSEAKLQLRVTVTDEDALIDLLRTAARERGELATHRAFQTQTWDLVLDRFPCQFIDVPKPPLVSVTHIKYYDTAGVQQTWASANYLVSAPSGPRCSRGRITPAYGVSWPTTQCRIDAVSIRFVCGYGTAASVPAMLKTAMLLDLGTLFENREDVVAGMTVIAMLPRDAAAIYRSYRSHPVQ